MAAVVAVAVVEEAINSPLAQHFSPDEIEACIGEQLQKGGNVCEPSGRTEEIVGVLAKAEFVKALMAKGATLPEAMRELGRRMRAVQQRGGAAG
ncbi:MAG: hypothetical protein ACYCZQ_00030 [Burkholderiales bacterium]